MRLRHETHGAGNQLMRNPFSTALKIGAVSAALLLPFGTINPVFANKAPMSAPSCPKNTVSHSFVMPVRCGYGLGYSPLYESESFLVTPPEIQSAIDKINLIRETKVKYADALFLAQYPHYDLLAQDYGIIRQLNDSLPEQKRMSISEWATYQMGYVCLTRNYNIGTALQNRKSYVSLALSKTERQYQADLRAAGYCRIYVRLFVATPKTRLASEQNAISASRHSHKEKAAEGEGWYIAGLIYLGVFAGLAIYAISTNQSASGSESSSYEDTDHDVSGGTGDGQGGDDGGGGAGSR